MKILLIGHKGYVGSGLFRYLIRSHQVTGWSRKDNILSITLSKLKELKIDAVVNCSTIMDRTNANYIVGSPSEQVNVDGVRTLVNALKGTDIRLIHISTKDVFGNVYSENDVIEEKYRYLPKFLVNDNQAFAPETIYAKTKLVGEFLIESHPLATVIRLSSCYTDYYHPRGSWIVKIIEALLKNKPITVTKEGKQFRDLLNAEDLGEIIEQVLNSNKFGTKINVGGGTENTFSILEVIRMVSENAKIEYVSGGDFGFAFNNHSAKDLYGWQPSIKFTDRFDNICENILNSRQAT